MPKLLMCNLQKGWPFFQRLLVDLFKFMEPYLRNAELGQPVSFVPAFSVLALGLLFIYLLHCDLCSVVCFADSPFVQRNIKSSACATA